MDDIAVDENLIRSLLQEQHPDLAGLRIREVDGGWDNQMWRLGDDLAVRIPRTPRAPELLRNELQWLPSLAERLPLPIPVPVRSLGLLSIGRAGEKGLPGGKKTWGPAGQAALARVLDHAAH